ncbi:flavodoxin family protein [Natranaerofaba carboxydovora]|uniref:flavodoxin family protein n=1 Tax=Natranaerofaba carboxydovora TaxID=2742683 RepID=UPI001F13E4B0|nr:NAD(P)H-dependent oxidoreductase [Natranaerofaba carboxydovora]UMZ75333.1 Iron-sulfur flavoprotein [Natranaerofaba carboxydovora]
MKISTFVASPRKKGNSKYIAEHFEKGVSSWYLGNKNNPQSNNIIRLTDYNINPCRGCGYCDDKAKCVIKDDMKTLYPIIEDSDIITFVTPIYFASVPAQFKAFIDRFQPYYAAKYLLNEPVIPPSNNKKVILYVVSGYNKQSFFENVKGILEIFCLNLNIDLTHSFYYGGIDALGEILNRPEILTEIETFGRNLQDEL